MGSATRQAVNTTSKPNPCMGLGLEFPGQPMSFMIASSLCYYFGRSSGPFTYSVFANWAPARCQAKVMGWVNAEMPGVSRSKRHEISGY